MLDTTLEMVYEKAKESMTYVPYFSENGIHIRSDQFNSEPSDKTGTLSIPTKKEKRDRSSVEEMRLSTHSRKELMNSNLLKKIRFFIGK